MLNGRAPVSPDDAELLASVLKCSADDLVSTEAGPITSGGAIFDTHGMDGRHLEGVRPLTKAQWRAALAELSVLDLAGPMPD